MIRLDPPAAVRWITRTLEEAGYETWAVGGAVRDALADRPSGDWDLTTRATPADVRRVFRRTVPVGIEHGTVGVLARDETMYEVTTFRRDVETAGRHAVVQFAETLEEDLARRDFTINAVAWHPLREDLCDPYQGSRDMELRVLRTVGDPEERFSEDYLRVLRALRFAGTFELRIESESWRALTAAVDHLGILSPERIREEMEKILAGNRRSLPSRALALYAASGCMERLYPEISGTVGHPRDDGTGDLLGHALRVVDQAPAHRPLIRWAALLHGVGEPVGSTGAGEEGAGPEARALLRSAAVLERYRSSNARIRDVSELARWALRPPAADAPEPVLRRWLAEVGRERLPDLLRLWAASARADEALGKGWTRSGFCILARRLRGVARSGEPLTVEELALDGRALIAMGFRPGPDFGRVLRHLLELVLEDPSRNDADFLGTEALRWMKDAGAGEEVR
jgi:tRNA nucleotidyltransferase (CCA-adding enzyme)